MNSDPNSHEIGYGRAFFIAEFMRIRVLHPGEIRILTNSATAAPFS